MRINQNLLLTIILLTWSDLLFAGILELGVGDCNGKVDYKELFNVDKSSQKVLSSAYNLDGTPFGTPQFLDNCKVIDDANWVCGGNSDQLPNGVTIVWSSRTIAKGIMFYKNTHRIELDGSIRFISAFKDRKYCYYTKNLFGYTMQPYKNPNN